MVPAEKIRAALGIDFEEFSFRLGYSHPTYRNAFNRGYLTKRMAKEIARRYHIAFRDFLQEPARAGGWKMHRHLCLVCDTVIREGEFDCESDEDHDQELCDKCLAAGITAEDLNQ